MITKALAMMAALALATTAWAQGGGGAGGAGGTGGSTSGTDAGSKSGDRAAGGSGTASGQTGGGATKGSMSEDSANQAAAQQQAPSVTGLEGPGGRTPRPVAEGQGGERQFGNAPPVPAGQQGRLGTQSGPTAGSAAATTPDAQGQVTGRVAAVNSSEREIAIDAGTATTQVKVAEDAKITIDGKKATFQEIPKGAEVRASLEKKGDELQAKHLEVTSKKTKK